MSHALDKETVNRILQLHQLQGLSPQIIGQRFGFSTARIYNIIRRQAASSKRQDYINGERLQHALGWKGSSDFGPKPKAASSKRQASSALKKTQS